MQYVGHFSFEEALMGTDSVNEDEWYGHFTLVEDASDVEAAIAKFSKLIHKLHKKGLLFTKGSKIYMEACIEILKTPRDGMLTYYCTTKGAVPDGVSISSSALGASEVDAISYYVGEEEHKDGVSYEPTPFIILDDLRDDPRDKKKR